MKLDYDPNVKVQMIRPKNKHKSDIKSAIDETAKYPVKDTDFMTDDEERNLQVVSDLEEGLHRKRLISYGGLLKEIHKKLNLDDAEDGDLIHTEDRKSTRLNSSHVSISYAVFCLKKKKTNREEAKLRVDR